MNDTPEDMQMTDPASTAVDFEEEQQERDATFVVGGDAQADEDPQGGQVEDLNAETPPDELPDSTIEAIGRGPTDRVVVPVEQEEPIPAPAEQAGSDRTAEAAPEDVGADVVVTVGEAPAEEPAPAAEAPVEEEKQAPPAANDPFRGAGDWYVVHTYAGYENKVKANLESRIHTMQMEDKIFNVHIPMEDVMEIKGGKKQVVQRKVFPGYLLVKMEYDNDSWYVVRNTPGVTGFVAAGTGSKPTPLSRREVEKILAVKKEEVKPQFRLGFEEGDVVRIISGPFADFNGTISEINVDQSKLKVLVNIFDRETPVELGFDQVAKV
jgi:transcription termination/antitermination protein NusG